ncbi:T9SS type A sorting domain-containing protein [Candidatus Syntrophosphaera thermopropionivorans]|uniref:T9SS type A sorting domain-containing protein n=1 Tax=Candidatus Syntrophosphaera thermopropionivorans TaxID=2593015 RepID=A0AC61QLD2_9BACT|nr:T9SS type A sorting domain-containing protein [Candidatus Syntrophosphaera thermopropionivorans]TDF74750.1 T9SS type A sorting domain-containing protein [Candidatus Syntrophosphaera thermopropionivorans]
MKKLTLLIITLALFTLAFADTYFIGTGTSTSGFCPFYGYYDYSWSKAIWTAAELTTAGVPANTPITGIGFYVGNTPSNYTMLDQRIYVRTTALTSYGTAQDETGTGYPNPAYFLPLFQGNLTYNGGGWHYIMFTTPATWDGTSNLELLFENWDGEYVSGYPTFRYTSTSPNYMMVYKYQDDSFPAGAGNSSYNRPNVAIITPSTTPPEAPVLSLPLDGATGVNEYTTFSWAAPQTGSLPTGYKLYCDTNNPPTTLIVDQSALSYTLTTPLAYNTTYYWTVSAYNALGEGPQATVRSFTTRADPTINSLPYTESFEEGNTDGSTNIANWAQVAGPEFTTKYWTANSTQTTYNRTPRTGSFNVTLQYNGSAWLFRPVSLIGGTTYEFEAYARQDGSNSADATLGLYYGTAATIAAMTSITGQVGLVNGDYQRIYGVFSPATSGIYYLGIKGWININPWYISLDDVTIREAPTAPVFSYSPTSINFGLLMQNVPSTPANVTVTNLGGGTIHIESSNISITGPNAAMFSFSDANLPADLNAGQSVIIPVTAIVTQEGPVSATLIITYEGTPYEVALSAEGLSSEIVIIGTGTDDLSLPIEPYYGYSYSQSIFLQSEINMARPIEKIYYYWNGAAATVNSNNWTVYMGHTPNTSFDSGTAWIPLSNLTEVFSGTVTLPAIEGWVEIILTTPFTYNNVDNLVVAVDENADSYDSYNEYFYCTSELKTNRSIRYYSDGTNPDPLAPPTGTPVAGYPNIMLKFEEEQPPLPVELSSFTAVLTNDFYVQLTWVSQTETNLSGYRVYRNEENTLNNAILITPTMIPATNTSQEHIYTVEDREVENNTTYYYWLESVDFNNSQFHGPVIVTVEGNVPPVLPEVTTLNNAYPNPFRANNSTKIEVGIKAGESGTLTIYNIRGEIVKAIKVNEGYHTIIWDGKDSKGTTCGSGIYFYRLTTPSLNQTKKMVIVK